MTVRVVDLFAGAGGLSTGIELVEGAQVVLAVEASPVAAATYRANHRGDVIAETIGANYDVRSSLKELLDDPRCDLLVGGPPCQGWSSLGPRGRPERRAELNACLGLFADQVRLLRPPAFLVENVRGLLVRDRGRHLQAFVDQAEVLGYSTSWHDVRGVDFGVPQLRHRVFIVGVDRELGLRYELPLARPIRDRLTVWDGIGDLPGLGAGESSDQYAGPPRTPYQKLLRGRTRRLTWHVAPNHSPRTREILAALRGDGASRSGFEEALGLTSGFHNTYCRLRSTEPAPAITSSAGRVSSGRNAHPFDDRALTPREAARLQGFHDSYRWCGDRWPVYTQIGNAVPPPLAAAIAAPLVEILQRAP